MPAHDARTCSLLTTALVGALLPKDVAEGHIVRAWLDSWSGVGHVAETMHEVGYNMRLTRTVFDWRAEFCRNELPQLIRWIGGAGDMKAPWRAVQRAALETLRQEGTARPR